MKHLADEIERQKRQAVENHDKPNDLVLITLLVSCFLAVCVIVVFNTPVKKTMLSGVVGGITLGLILGRVLNCKSASCPRCGTKWETGKDGQSDILTKPECPGCSLELRPSLPPDPVLGNPPEMISCYRCHQVVASTKAQRMWRLPLMVLTAFEMKPATEGERLYCKDCLNSMNTFICVIAGMGLINAVLFPRSAFYCLLAAITGLILSAGWRRWKERNR